MAMFSTRPNRMHRNRARAIHNEPFDNRQYGEALVGLKPEIWWKTSLIHKWAKVNKITLMELKTFLLRRKYAKLIKEQTTAMGDTLETEIQS